MTPSTHQGLVLGIHPTSRGFGWVLFEGQMTPVDWGLASAKTGRNAKLLRRFERLLNRYQPAVIVLEQFEGHPGGRVGRIQSLCRSLVHIAHCRGVEAFIYERAVVRTCFASIGAKTRYEIAQAIAQRIDAFRRRLPPVRKQWESDDGRLGLFDAAALAITYFAVHGEDL